MKKRHPLIRFFKHLVSHAFLGAMWQIKQHFPSASLRKIETAITASETTHAGQIRFVVETGLPPLQIIRGKTPKQRALELFSLLNIWDTEHNNGVLIYLLLADRDVEIVADRGVHQHVGNQGWEEICTMMEKHFRAGAFEAGVLQGIQQITQHLSQHFPPTSQQQNELSDRPLVL